MCYNGNYKGMQKCELEQILKNYPSLYCRLQLACMKSIVSNRKSARYGEFFLGLAQTARHVMGIKWVGYILFW